MNTRTWLGSLVAVVAAWFAPKANTEEEFTFTQHWEPSIPVNSATWVEEQCRKNFTEEWQKKYMGPPKEEG